MNRPREPQRPSPPAEFALTTTERLLVTSMTLATGTRNLAAYKVALNGLSDSDLFSRFIETRSNETLPMLQSGSLAVDEFMLLLKRPTVVQRVGELCRTFGYRVNEFVMGTVAHLPGNPPGQSGPETHQLLNAYDALIQEEVTEQMRRTIQASSAVSIFLDVDGYTYTQEQVVSAVRANLQLQQAYARANDEYGGGSRNPDAQSIETAQAQGYEALSASARADLAAWARDENQFVPEPVTTPRA